MTVIIDGASLSVDDVVRVARFNEPVELAESALDGILRSRDVIERALSEGRIVYGVNTGFGDFAQVSIGSDDLAKLQVNLIRSHSVGVGDPFSIE
ncbi:MAG: aromatic amino acid lyase, partial [Candidatus Hodarchaeota archaeon]